MNAVVNMFASGVAVALLSLCSCAPKSHEVPVQGTAQSGGGSSTGSMAFPAPVPQGNLAITPTR